MILDHPMGQRGGHLDEPVPFGAVVGNVIDDITAASRRLGQPGREREEIPPALRRLVFMRDDFTCRWCGNRLPLTSVRRLLNSDDIAPFQLDHIVPHAAGGCDHAHNLRVLCRYCNEMRSNYATDQYARALPVTPECVPCQLSALQAVAEAADWDCDLPQLPPGQRHIAYCGTCRLTSWVNDEALLW